VPASSILILETDPESTTSLAPILAGAGYVVTRTAKLDEGFARIVDHQLVVLDLGGGGGGAAPAKSGIEMCREIRATPSMAAVPTLCVAAGSDVEERIGFLEAGADDVIARPFDAREVEARVEALLLRFQRSQNRAPVTSPDGLTVGRARRVVSVFSPKGGVGTTTIAVNVAVVAAQGRRDRIAIIDLDLQFGGVATLLNLEPKQTLADVIRDEAALREPDMLRSYAMRHDSGLHVLAAPTTPDTAELITPTHVSHILGTALEAYDAIVVDAGSTLDERVLTVFESSEVVILPVYPEISALKAVHSLLDYLNEAGTIGGKSIFVLNNMFARDILKPRDIESAIGTRITLDLPYDPFLYLKAANEGIPIVIGASRSAPSERLVRLSTSAFGVDGHAALAAEPERKGGLFGRRRKA
jgi:pilus assembly protein CpaE